MLKIYRCNRIALIMCSVTLFGCVAAYVPPTGEAVAHLRVIAKNSDMYVVASKHTSTVCGRESPNFPNIGAKEFLDKSTAGFPDAGAPSWERFERNISANSEFSISTASFQRYSMGESALVLTQAGAQHVRDISWSCVERIKFVPSPKAFYELVLDYGPQGCAVALSEFINSPTGIQRKPVEFKQIKESAFLESCSANK